MFWAARDPFAFIRNGIRLHSTAGAREEGGGGRSNSFHSPPFLPLLSLPSSTQWRDGTVGSVRDGRGGTVRGSGGRRRDKGSPVDGLKYGDRYKESGAAQHFEKKYRSGDGKGEGEVLPSRRSSGRESEEEEGEASTKGDAL